MLLSALMLPRGNSEESSLLGEWLLPTGSGNPRRFKFYLSELLLRLMVGSSVDMTARVAGLVLLFLIVKLKLASLPLSIELSFLYRVRLYIEFRESKFRRWSPSLVRRSKNFSAAFG